MKTYSYSAVDSEGVPQTGTMKAVSRQQAVDTLRKRKFIVTNLDEKKESEIIRYFKNLQGIPSREKVVFTRQLGTMVGSGLPINQALRILAEQTSNRFFSQIIMDIAQQIDGGASLYDSMSNYSKEFGRLFLSLVQAGESSGNLELILMRIADSLEADDKFKSQVKGALIYPVIIVMVMIGVLMVMFVFVIPRLSDLYDDLGAELPFMTQLLINFSNLLADYFYVFALAIAGLVFGFKRLMKQRKFAARMSVLQIRTPIFGSLIGEVQLTSFTRTLGMLLGSGIPMLEAIEISKETFSNLLYREAADDAAAMVEKGKTLSEGFKQHDIFPPMVGEMMAIGEQTGKTEDILAKLSEYFENQATNKTDNLASAIEPIVMVLLGVIVGFLVVSLILPIYSLTSQF